MDFILSRDKSKKISHSTVNLAVANLTLRCLPQRMKHEVGIIYFPLWKVGESNRKANYLLEQKPFKIGQQLETLTVISNKDSLGCKEKGKRNLFSLQWKSFKRKLGECCHSKPAGNFIIWVLTLGGKDTGKKPTAELYSCYGFWTPCQMFSSLDQWPIRPICMDW